MKIKTHFHNEADKVIDLPNQKCILKIIENTSFIIQPGCGDKLRKTILSELRIMGWSNSFSFDVNSQISITAAFKDYILCFQTGNMGRFYADLLKMQYLFANEKAKAGFYILPSKEAAKIIGSNIAHFDRLKNELKLFNQIITIPIIVIGIN